VPREKKAECPGAPRRQQVGEVDPFIAFHEIDSGPGWGPWALTTPGHGPFGHTCLSFPQACKTEGTTDNDGEEPTGLV
jgi:hypothetical protein